MSFDIRDGSILPKHVAVALFVTPRKITLWEAIFRIFLIVRGNTKVDTVTCLVMIIKEYDGESELVLQLSSSQLTWHYRYVLISSVGDYPY